MSMSPAEQRLPQFCYCHPGPRRSFQPREGRFVDRCSRFICHACANSRWGTTEQAKPVQRQGNRAAEQVAHHLTRLKYAFQREFAIGEFSYDFAFPHLKLLLEVDGRTYHRYKPAGKDTVGSREWTAAHAGWTLVHVRNGPGLAKRAVSKVVKAAYAKEAVVRS